VTNTKLPLFLLVCLLVISGVYQYLLQATCTIDFFHNITSLACDFSLDVFLIHIQYPCCSLERLWVVVDLKRRYRSGLNEWTRQR